MTHDEIGKTVQDLQIFYGPLQDSMTLVTAECVSGDIMFRDR
jgi:hypothetical protein